MPILFLCLYIFPSACMQETSHSQENRQNGNYDTLPLPKTLSNLQKVSIKHFIANTQSGTQCGSRAIVNALAIQEIMEQQGIESVNQENVQAIAHSLKNIITDAELYHDEVIDLAREKGVKNLHIVCFNNELKSPYIYGSTRENNKSLKEQIEEIYKSTGMTHFVYCSGTADLSGHYTLITLIKNANSTPALIYMDSCNHLLGENCIPTVIIQWLYEIITSGGQPENTTYRNSSDFLNSLKKSTIQFILSSHTLALRQQSIVEQLYQQTTNSAENNSIKKSLANEINKLRIQTTNRCFELSNENMKLQQTTHITYQQAYTVVKKADEYLVHIDKQLNVITSKINQILNISKGEVDEFCQFQAILEKIESLKTIYKKELTSKKQFFCFIKNSQAEATQQRETLKKRENEKNSQMKNQAEIDAHFKKCLKDFLENLEDAILVPDTALYNFDFMPEAEDLAEFKMFEAKRNKKKNDERWFKSSVDNVAYNLLQSLLSQLIITHEATLKRKIKEIPQFLELYRDFENTNPNETLKKLTSLIDKEKRKLKLIFDKQRNLLQSINRLSIICPEFESIDTPNKISFARLQVYHQNAMESLSNKYALWEKTLNELKQIGVKLPIIQDTQKKESKIFEKFQQLCDSRKADCIKKMDPIEDDLADQIIDQTPDAKETLEGLIESPDETSSRYLLIGEYGAGKTVLAKALAQKCKRTPIWINAATISTTFQNDASQRLTQILDITCSFAKENPNEKFIIIIDEIDTAKGQESNQQNENSRASVFTALHASIDSLDGNDQIAFIGITYYTQGIPEDTRSRFCPFVVNIPDSTMRKRIFLNILLNKPNITIDKTLNMRAIHSLSGKLNNFSVRTLKDILSQACLRFSKPLSENKSRILTADSIAQGIEWYKTRMKALAKKDRYAWEKYLDMHPHLVPVANLAINASSLLSSTGGLIQNAHQSRRALQQAERHHHENIVQAERHHNESLLYSIIGAILFFRR